MIQASCAMYPGFTHEQSVIAMLDECSSGSFAEIGLGSIGLDHLQLVPQNKGQITPEMIARLQALMPNTKFRLHANVPVLERHEFFELSDFGTGQSHDYFQALRLTNRYLASPDYSLHSGRRTCSLAVLFEKARRLQDFLGARVAIEGQYKTIRSGAFLVNCWKEYEALFNSGCFYALDLSHLNIVARAEGREDGLVQELLSSPRCIEVHVSQNDGSGDQHQRLSENAWWAPFTRFISSQAVVFTEGNRRASKPSKNSAESLNCCPNASGRCNKQNHF